jgi:hypothetical protein
MPDRDKHSSLFMKSFCSVPGDCSKFDCGNSSRTLGLSLGLNLNLNQPASKEAGKKEPAEATSLCPVKII